MTAIVAGNGMKVRCVMHQTAAPPVVHVVRRHELMRNDSVGERSRRASH